VGGILVSSPTAAADPDGGVCVLKNGVPFYIPPGGYTHGPEDVITGPVTKPPCKSAPSSSNPPSPSKPSIPSTPDTTTSSPSPSPEQQPAP
jgi:hypothetical protein